jgi:hypothetical protein
MKALTLTFFTVMICLAGTSQNIYYKDNKWVIDQKIILAEFTKQYNHIRDSFHLNRIKFDPTSDSIAKGHSKYMSITNDYQHGKGDHDFDYMAEEILGRNLGVYEGFYENIMKISTETLPKNLSEKIKQEKLEKQIGKIHSLLVLGKEISYQELAKFILEGWMNSEGHRKNLLQKKLVSFSFSCEIGPARCFYPVFVAN